MLVHKDLFGFAENDHRLDDKIICWLLAPQSPKVMDILIPSACLSHTSLSCIL